MPYGGQYGVATNEGPGWMQFRNVKAKEDLFTPESQKVPATMAAAWTACAAKFGKQRCLGTRQLVSSETIKDPNTGKELLKCTYGAYRWMTYNRTNERILAFAKGLISMGVKPKENVCIFMNTMADWQVASQACFQAGIVLGTIYATLGDEALAYGFNQTESSTVITEGALLPAIAKIAKDCPHLKSIIYNGEKPKDVAVPEGVTLYAYEDVIKTGKAADVSYSEPKPEDVAVIMYTSGSTGLPKGVMLTHHNMTSACIGFKEALPTIVPGEDCFMGFLPLAHIFALCSENFLLNNGCMIGYGGALTLTDNSPKIKAGTKGDISELRPTYLAAVPTIMDRIRQAVTGKVAAGSPLVQKLFHKAFESKKAAMKKGKGTPIWDAIVFNKIKSVLGGRIKEVFSGGAPLAADSQLFMNVVFGVPVCQGYGLTETCSSATIAHHTDRDSFGKVGGPLVVVDLKLKDWEEGNYKVTDKDDKAIGMPRGEVLLGGPCIASGYYKMPEKTAEEFIADESGKVWFHTGDIGQVHKSGTLQIIDRKKDLVKLQQGEYVSLGKVESMLKAANYIDNMMVYADPFHSYCVAIVTVLAPAVAAFAEKNGIQKEWADLVKDPKIVAEVLASLQKEAKSSKLAKFETPQKIFIEADPWLPESGLVTASLKLQRNNLKKHYEAEISKLLE
ncbi:hypothetical protein SARC_03453 [Sphaeroforma arctica JP610]|uniref:AMP-dependent synthetase/ligase domain-containing protein n=1 Tax=Sphaeroforma arctica JP610 TaxID=667725 RepID=A0A0L0G5U9_9EUKA|nr:hypothetical protein SARC_03453 [Sphaeroforma arctica JP610]KNC84329.1 hypothetical protein SARC_03453 [Sphaeroforma arctica JP610]|eukprot:XP_014158231.1 hypothetical protein SARC_03453 [Sphaeroforma arctica JP610]